jgi:serine/threonine-protein kinase HipA
VLSTTYYPELAKKMAMKIGGEYASDKVTPRHFEKLAEETSLSKPMVRRRVLELAETILAAIPGVDSGHAATADVAAHVKNRCISAAKKFQ